MAHVELQHMDTQERIELAKDMSLVEAGGGGDAWTGATWSRDKSLTQKLQELVDAKNKGLLTDAEYSTLRERMLGIDIDAPVPPPPPPPPPDNTELSSVVRKDSEEEKGPPPSVAVSMPRHYEKHHFANPNCIEMWCHIGKS